MRERARVSPPPYAGCPAALARIIPPFLQKAAENRKAEVKDKFAKSAKGTMDFGISRFVPKKNR